MAMEKEMPPCHGVPTPAEDSDQLQFTSTCCCDVLSCAKLEVPLPTALTVEGLTTSAPTLGLALHISFKSFTAPVTRTLHPARTAPLRTTTVPLYQLNSSFLI